MIFLRMISKYSLLSIAVSLLLLGAQAHAATYVLYSQGMPVKNYDQLVSQLEEGDTVYFSHKKFKLGKSRNAGSGSNTFVFELAGKRKQVIRIASKSINTIYIDYTIRGGVALVQHSVPHTRIIESEEGEYVVVEALPENMISLRDAVEKALKDHTLRPKIERAIVDFSRASAKFTQIGDFRFDQLAFISGGPETGMLILFDWRDDHFFYPHEKHEYVFDNSVFEALYMYFSSQAAQMGITDADLAWFLSLRDTTQAATWDQRNPSLTGFNTDLEMSSAPALQTPRPMGGFEKCVRYLVKAFGR